MENISKTHKKKKQTHTISLRTGAPIEDICGTRFVHHLLLCVAMVAFTIFQVEYLFFFHCKLRCSFGFRFRLRAESVGCNLEKCSLLPVFFLYSSLVVSLTWCDECALRFQQECYLAVHMGWNRKHIQQQRNTLTQITFVSEKKKRLKH